MLLGGNLKVHRRVGLFTRGWRALHSRNIVHLKDLSLEHSDAVAIWLIQCELLNLGVGGVAELAVDLRLGKVASQRAQEFASYIFVVHCDVTVLWWPSLRPYEKQ